MNLSTLFIFAVFLKSSMVRTSLPIRPKEFLSINYTTYAVLYGLEFESPSVSITSITKQNNTSEAEKKLLWLFTDLKIFIHETYFDSLEFEKYVDILEEDLAGISEFIDLFVFDNNHTSKQLRFTSKVFQVMVFGFQILKQYNFLGRKDHDLVSRMTETNIMLLALFDVDGNRDPFVKKLPEKLVYFVRKIYVLNNEFNDLMEVSDTITMFFKQQKRQAERLLKNLLVCDP